MLYGTAKVVTEYMERGKEYDNISKVFSINIVYFDLGQGTDYVYHGRTDFRGLHDGEPLKLSQRQRELFGGEEPADLLPEYYVLKVNNFNKVAKESLDQWISFLKTGDIPEYFDAQGLPEAREKLRIDNLSDEERRNYFRELDRRMVEDDVMRSYYVDGQKDRELEIARSLKGKVPVEVIMESTGLSAEDIAAL
jgi:hypothetical protein